MRKRFGKSAVCIGIAALTILCQTGCGKINYPALPDDATAFNMGDFVDDEHDDASYGTIECYGRKYIPYGTPNKKYSGKNIGQCIGYVIMDENSTSVPDPENKNDRIYTLEGDAEHNFLVEYDDSIELMASPPFILRAIDTKGKDIEIPQFVDSQDYEYWEE